MGRLLYVVFDDSNSFGSRMPSASAPYPSFCDAETKAPFPASYNSITISTPRLPRGSHSSLMMEAVRTSETSVDNYFTRQYIPEDNSEHHTRRRENLKSHMQKHNLHGHITKFIIKKLVFRNTFMIHNKC
jgi:hypothetical protein